VIRSRQFILSRIDARNGAFGIVPYFLDGAVVSNDFPTFHVDAHRLLPDYLGWLSRTHGFVDLCRAASEGTTNRVRLKEDRFLSTTIHLPPLDEQQRIVARIEELAAKIEEARGLRQRTIQEADDLLATSRDRAFRLRDNWTVASVGDFCNKPQYGYTESASLEPVGPRFLRITDIQNGQVDWSHVPFCRCPNPDQYLLKENDFVFARTGATTGKSFVIRECPEAVFASYLIRLRVRELVSVDYLYQYFQSSTYWARFRNMATVQAWLKRHPHRNDELIFDARRANCHHIPRRAMNHATYWGQIADEKKGTGQSNLNGSKLSSLRVPIAPPEVQKRIVGSLEDLQAKVDVLKRLQAETATELDALLPSVLSRVLYLL